MPGLESLGLGNRIGEPRATGLLMIWHQEFTVGRPIPSKGHRGVRNPLETDTICTLFSD